jgi:predicted DsbA family dithiol-disulfide isomerase
VSFFDAGKKGPNKENIQHPNNSNKPIEIYVFVDPLCPECWALEPLLKKLQLEYGNFLTVRHVLSSGLKSLNITKKTGPTNIAEVWETTASRSGMSCDGDLWYEEAISTPHTASIGIKAAELQGKLAGLRFLRKLQELLFLEKQDISKEEVLIQIAKDTNLDVDEFWKDFHSESATKAFQYDLQLTSEMEVEKSPTIVFFNENIEEEGLKVTGCFSYDIYVEILTDMLGKKPEPATLPSMESFLEKFKFVAAREIEVVYDMEPNEVERKLKKLMLKQQVEIVPVKYGTFWRYVDA